MTSVRRQADAIALGLGARVTVSGLLLACVLTIAIGAMSMLRSLQALDGDLKTMSAQIDVANKGTVQLNQMMDSLPPTDAHLVKILASTADTAEEVAKSGAAIGAMRKDVSGLAGMLGGITTSVGSMRGSVEELGRGTGELNSLIGGLNTKIAPLAATQKKMVGHVNAMGTGMGEMNGSLAYVIRVLNYMTAPPNGQSFSVKVELDKKALPPVPGVHAKTDPVAVFKRNAWPVYTGP